MNEIPDENSSLPDDKPPIAGEETVADKTSDGAPGEAACPVCEKIIPAPLPSICPHCNAPIDQVLAILKTSNLSLNEALRDISAGDLESAKNRLDLVRLSSRKHRLKAEAIKALILRIEGNPSGAIAILNSVKEKSDLADVQLNELIRKTEELCIRDQASLAACCEHYNFALFQAKRGFFEEARSSLQKALKLVPAHAPSHALMGKVSLALEHYDSAQYHFRRALAVDPSNASASRYLTRTSDIKTQNPFSFGSRIFRFRNSWMVAVTAVGILILIALIVLLNG